MNHDQIVSALYAAVTLAASFAAGVGLGSRYRARRIHKQLRSGLGMPMRSTTTTRN